MPHTVLINPTPIVVTLAPIAQASLPPTWTPVATETPLPTATITLTAPPTATLSAEDVCSAFHLITTPAVNAQLDYDASATFIWSGIPAGSTPVLTITLHGSNQPALRINGSGAGDTVLPIPLLRLPQAGLYDWKFWLQHPQYGQICVHSGTFTRKALTIL